MRGTSMTPLLRGETDSVHPDDEATVLFHRNQAYVRRGPWKLTAIEIPFDESRFGLYNLVSDPGETTDLSESKPEIRAQLIEVWREQRQELGIVLPQDL
jgi:arylsulfatase A-like enzyme